jgi:hypothetical protein
MEPEELLNDNNGKDKESPLLSLEIDLKLFNESIREVAIEIMVEGLSRYPIFVAHQHEVALGEMILDKDDINSDWSINASTLEEFIERFVDTYKKPEDFMCVFVIVPEGANFVFFPYVKD